MSHFHKSHHFLTTRFKKLCKRLKFSGTKYQESNHVHKMLILSQVKLNGKALTDIKVKSCPTERQRITFWRDNVFLFGVHVWRWDDCAPSYAHRPAWRHSWGVVHITYLDGVTSRTAKHDVTARGGGIHITQLGNVTIATMYYKRLCSLLCMCA